MVEFRNYPTNFRTIFRSELDLAKSYLHFINKIEELNKRLFIKTGDNTGDMVDIETDNGKHTIVITYENTRRWLGYTCDTFIKKDFKRSVSRITKVYSSEENYFAKYRLFLNIFISNCNSVLKDSNIHEYLSAQKTNIVKVIHCQKFKDENDDYRNYKTGFYVIEFIHATNLQSFRLKITSGGFEEKDFIEHEYWQITIENNDISEITRSDASIFERHMINK